MDRMAMSPGRTRAVLIVVALALMTVVSAVSGLNVALAGLARDTGASQSQLTWIVDAYTVVFAGLLLFAGALGDRFGRRGLLVAGLVVFGAAAAVGMITEDPTQLIVVRAFMGVGAAAIMPTTLSVITTSFPEARAAARHRGLGRGGRRRRRARPVRTGILLEYFAWNSFFALNVTLAVTRAWWARWRWCPARATRTRRGSTSSAPCCHWWRCPAWCSAIIEGPDRGWTDRLTVSALVAGLIAAIAFIIWELRAPAPMLDPRLFRLRGFGAGSLAITAQFFSAFGFFFIALQYLQFVVGWSPLRGRGGPAAAAAGDDPARAQRTADRRTRRVPAARSGRAGPDRRRVRA